MSDPVTNAEVEDVLASIRRLVGDKKNIDTPYIAQAGPECLVLTPQQRVMDVPGVFQLTPEHSVSSGEAWQEFEEPPLDPQEEVSASTHEEAQAAEAVAAENDTLVLKSDQIIQENRGISAQTTQPKQARYSNLSDKIAALEMAIARTQQQWEPDEAGSDAYAGTAAPAMTWPAQEDLDELGRPLNAQPDDTVEDDAQILDEETLQQLVVDMMRKELRNGIVAEAVKEELQGELGTRITRNIRKLVRREIQRALSAEGLE